jgi:nucleoid-associated protein YgaU
MSVRIKRGSSRLIHAELVMIDGIEFWTRPDIPDLTPSTGDKEHRVQVGERLDTIAKKYYKQDGRHWVIAHRNNIKQMEEEVHVGTTLIISDPIQVRKELF